MKRKFVACFIAVVCLVPVGLAQGALVDDTERLNILTAFRQARGPNVVVNPHRIYGNCVSIAMIKTAMATFGVDGILISPAVLPSENDASSYSISLRNGHSLSLSHAEVDTAIHDLKYDSGFVLPDVIATGNPVILFKANFLYAVMAKEMLARKDVPLYLQDNPNTFEDALTIMGNGIDVAVDATAETPLVNQIGVLLGLDLQDVSAMPEPPNVPYMYALRKHTVFAYGDEGDGFGTRAPFDVILKDHSTFLTRGLGRNKHPSRYIIKVH